ncbi:hypothetical protein IHP33_04110 [Enterococcus faecalis]|uniref:hypothetical protein n=1 Tax=Enterococcus faecalis TaxID=1351 RepID=UPI001786B61A|nr:hypothetical protein [Enterococcus faecalis]MBD9844903.1 hypothetical protein [Enterococcus faecalis]
MANRVQRIALSEENIGKKIKVTNCRETTVYENGKQIRGRRFVASSELQPDFEIIVPNLRNSVPITGREEVRLIEPVARINARRNNISNTVSMDIVVYAKKLEVVKGEK